VHCIVSYADNQSSSEHPDIITNLKATTAHLDFHSHGYHSQLSAVLSDGTEKHVPTDGELESYVPSLPTGWAIGGVENVKKAAAAPAGPSKVVTKDKTEKKTRHKLPKGAVEGKAFTEDVS
jgi:signal recognition particle subunit SRP72